MTGSATIVQADARSLPLADDSVDLIVTSPPYFALRSYQDGGEHYAGQIGSETTPTEFLEALLDVTRECVRVLKSTGSLWVNLGDKYSGAQAQNIGGASRAGSSARTWAQTNPKRTGIPNKSLMGLPWRYAIACIDELGLTLRAEVVWSKPNGLPESVTDRVRRSHEQWFHFTLNPRYFSAVDEIREPYSGDRALSRRIKLTGAGAVGNKQSDRAWVEENPLGKLPGSVWVVPTEPLNVPEHLGVEHFAAFPTALPKRIVEGWSPTGICTACGQGRRPIVDVEQVPHRSAGATGRPKKQDFSGPHAGGYNGSGYPQTTRTTTILGYSCNCGEPTAATTPAVVLDPFGGTGTTATVAKALGRHGISVDMSADYCRLAEWRTGDPAQLAKVVGDPKPPPVDDDQLDVLAAIGGE